MDNFFGDAAPKPARQNAAKPKQPRNAGVKVEGKTVTIRQASDYHSRHKGTIKGFAWHVENRVPACKACKLKQTNANNATHKRRANHDSVR